MFKKIPHRRSLSVVSLVLALAMLLSMGVLAAAPTAAAPTLVYSDENIEVYTIAVALPTAATSGIAPQRSGYTGSGIAEPTAYLAYPCTAARGNYCRIAVDNTDAAATMSLTFEYTISGETYTASADVAAGTGYVTTIRSKNNSTGLSCSVMTTITAKNALSVSYQFSAEQSWETF